MVDNQGATLVYRATPPKFSRMANYPDHHHGYPSSFSDRIAEAAARGVRFVSRVGLAFGLAVVSAILLGAALTDNGLVQVFVTVLAAFGLWVPILLLLLAVERRLARSGEQKAAAIAASPAVPAIGKSSWQRLAAAAPAEVDRIGALQRSLETSAKAFRSADLDPDAHDLCILIDRRLPELIERELDALPPDDRGRRLAVGGLVELIEQFARHCSRKRDGRAQDTSYQAEVLRRRFEQQLSPPPFGDQ